MNIFQTAIPGVKIIKPNLYIDRRGSFLETYNSKIYNDLLGAKLRFVQDNYSISNKSVLRGLHYQKKKPQGKLVYCSHGEILDVIVDIREDSPTYSKWISWKLNSDEYNQIWIPPGLAHGFITLSDSAIFNYKCTAYYDPEDEGSIIWNDSDLNIDWPAVNPILSEKDMNAPKFIDL